MISCAIRRAMSDQAARRWSDQLVGDVVEGQHRAVLIAHALDREGALPPVGGDQDVRLGLLAAHELVEFGRDRASSLPSTSPRLAAAGSRQNG